MNRPQPGEKAPDFQGINQNEKTIKLSDFEGQKLILYFYPKDDTPGCTAQACSLGENFEGLKKKGFAVLGVSADSAKKHEKFIEKFKLPFDLLADTEKEVIQAYGAWGRKKFMGKEFDGILRTTFIIGPTGLIEHVISKPDTKNHAQEIERLYA
jgi:thioredoxin-dependent peroxiredoxin